MEKIKMIGYQNTPKGEELQTLKMIFRAERGEILWAIIKAYLYGVMQGKRQERNKKNRRIQHV